MQSCFKQNSWFLEKIKRYNIFPQFFKGGRGSLQLKKCPFLFVPQFGRGEGVGTMSLHMDFFSLKTSLSCRSNNFECSFQVAVIWIRIYVKVLWFFFKLEKQTSAFAFTLTSHTRGVFHHSTRFTTHHEIVICFFCQTHNCSIHF